MKGLFRRILTSAFFSIALLFTQNSWTQLTSRPPGDSFPCPGEWIPDCNPKIREIAKQLQQIKTGILPNPTRTYFTVHIPDIENGDADIKVFDVNGKLLFETSGRSFQTYRFGNGFIPGLYFIQVGIGGKQVKVKGLKL